MTKVTKVKLLANMSITLSTAKEWNIVQILENGHSHIIGEAIITVTGLEAGSKIRRPVTKA